LRVDYFPHYPDKYAGIIPPINPDARVIPGELWMMYHSKWKLVLYWWPRLLAYGVRILATVARDRPQAFVAWTHLVLAPLALARSLGFVRQSHAVLFGFIYTDRTSRVLGWLRERYFRWLLKRIDLVVVHSSREAEDYARRFGLADKFQFIPCNIRDPLREIDANLPPAGSIVCAGKSNRDYDLLMAVAREFPDRPLEIISDDTALDGRPLPPNVAVHAACYGRAFRNKLAQAAVVLLPLKNADFSAGQLVLIEAMGLGQAIVITRAAGTLDYVDPDRTAVFIPPGDAAAAAAAVGELLADADRRRALGAAARAEFLARFDVHAVFRQLHEALVARFDPAAPSALRGPHASPAGTAAEPALALSAVHDS
jgi:glycosyltransferase involved in cell wall biosynthesis